jgi:DNA-binding GntR family transcriptional regulator
MSDILHRDTSLEMTAEFLRNQILNGVYKPGMQLKQSVIANQLGVSQGPTREALIQLEGEGLIEKIPYRGMFVRILSEKDVEEIYQLRGALEILAIRVCLDKLTLPDNLDKLGKMYDAIIQAESSTDYNQAVLADLNFHRFMVELSGNMRLLDIWDSLLAQCRYLLQRLYEFQNQTRGESLGKNHDIVINAIRTGDFNHISRVMLEHMDFAKNEFQKFIADNSQDY